MFQHCLFLSSIFYGFKANLRCLFISSSWLSVSRPLSARIPLLSVNNHCITSLGEVATCSATDECIGPLKSLKWPFSVYIEKCVQTQQKPPKHCSSGLQIFINASYSPIGSAYKSLLHVAMPLAVASLCILKICKNTKNPVKMALGGFEILFIFIPKPLRVWVSSHRRFPSYFV